jgi:hypothetical protein
MRCMMYSARLGTEFWVDALLHATWLYNRTYHSTIKMTPLQAFSGQIPALDSLITFGAKITAKKLGTRPSTLNPWAYDEIFLGYQNTIHNIKYWDINTGLINRIQAIRVFERYADIFSLVKQRVNFLQKEIERRYICTNFGDLKRDDQRLKRTHPLSQSSIELRAIQVQVQVQVASTRTRTTTRTMGNQLE